MEGEFDWDEHTQGLILGAFFYGYILTNILGGILANYFGGKIVVGVSIFLTGILTLFSPLAARSSGIAFSVVRALEGAAEGIFYPGMNILVGSWYPKMERSKFTSYIFAGLELGTVVGMLGSGWLCSTDFLGGWPSVFYVSGVLSLIWVVIWMICIKDHAEDHPWISKAELQYIKEGCPKTKVGI
ncbi:putative transporter slc-17.2 [Armadillidium vulgare]|nr:putative transporter slc-17.2 [Armadillidium vulgare]